MYTHEIKVRVRYKETDNMGVVHHANYAVYYEYARTELLRERGVTYRQMEEQGVMMPVREVSSVFLASAHYDDLLTIRTCIEELTPVKIVFSHEIFNEAGVRLNTGRVVLVFMDAAKRRLTRAPKWFTDLFAETASPSSK